MSTVDVIVPCYRYAGYLRQCVESVLTQQGPAVRVLILDDASPDETPEVARKLVEEDSRVTYVRHRENKRHIRTYNAGIEWVSADYYLLLSADDYLLPGAFARAVGVLDAEPSVGYVFGNALTAFDNGTIEAGRTLALTGIASGDWIMRGSDFIRKSRAMNVVPTPTAVVRTRLQKECGGYKEELTHTGDMEMWYRLAARADVGFVEANQAVYRRHGANMSMQYDSDGRLPDLVQRRMAMDAFFAESGRYLPDEDAIRREMFIALAMEAISFACIAFDAGKLQAADQLTQYAKELSPDVVGSPEWRNLALRRMLGQRLWRPLHTVWQKLRSYP